MAILNLPFVLGQHQRFGAAWETTPGTPVLPSTTEFLKTFSTDFTFKQDQTPRDDANEGEDEYELVTEKRDVAFQIVRYFTPAAAGVAPPEAYLWQALFSGVPVVDAGVSVTYPLLNGPPASNRTALSLIRYHNAMEIFSSEMLTGSVIDEGKFTFSGTAKPTQTWTGKAINHIATGYALIDGNQTAATLNLQGTLNGRGFDPSGRVQVGAQNNGGAGYPVGTQADDTIAIGSSISVTDGDIVRPFCPTPTYATAPVLGHTAGLFTFGGDDWPIIAGEITVKRNYEWVEDEFGASGMTDAIRGKRMILGKFTIRARRDAIIEVARRKNYTERATVLRVGPATGRRVTFTMGKVVPMPDKITVGDKSAGTLDLPFIVLASAEGAVDALSVAYLG